MQSDLTPILSNSTVARGVLHQSYLKYRLEVPQILLTTQNNLGKFTNVLPLSTQTLGQTVRTFCQVVVLFSFFTKDSNFQHFVVAHTVLHKKGKPQDVCTFLTLQTHLTKFTVACAVLNIFLIFNESCPFEAKRELRRVN